MAYKLKVLAGSHIQDGKTFTKGKIVTSDTDLSKVYLGKFALVAEVPAEPQTAEDSTPTPEDAEQGQEPAETEEFREVSRPTKKGNRKAKG